MEAYKNQGPVDCSSDFDESKVKGKSVIVTGGNGSVYPTNTYFFCLISPTGANGLGKAYVLAFVKAG
jgi:hypothetical protein